MRRVAVVFVLLSQGVVSHAETSKVSCPERADDPETSRDLASIWFSKGIDFAALEKYDLAEQAFMCSYHLVEHPATLLNAAKAAKHSGAIDGAVNAYKEYLDKYPDDQKVDAVKEEIARLKAQQEEDGPVTSETDVSSKTETEAGAEVPGAVEDAFDESGPVASDWRLLYDVARYEAAAKRYANAVELFKNYLDRGGDEISDDKRAEVEAEIGRLLMMEQEAQEIVPEPEVAETRATAPERETASTETEAEKPKPLAIAGWVSLGVGGATLIAAIATGAVALSYNGDLEKDCEGRDCYESYQHDKIDSMHKLANATDALIGVGCTMVAAGAAMLIVEKLRKGESADPVALTPTLGPGLSGVGIAGEF